MRKGKTSEKYKKGGGREKWGGRGAPVLRHSIPEKGEDFPRIKRRRRIPLRKRALKGGNRGIPGAGNQKSGSFQEEKKRRNVITQGNEQPLDMKSLESVSGGGASETASHTITTTAN